MNTWYPFPSIQVHMVNKRLPGEVTLAQAIVSVGYWFTSLTTICQCTISYMFFLFLHSYIKTYSKLFAYLS